MTSRLLRHTAAAMRAHNVLCKSYNTTTVEMNRCSFRRVRFALLYIVTRSKKCYNFCLMVEASDHGYVLHTRRIHVTRYRI
jgi:hypothetical protein